MSLTVKEFNVIRNLFFEYSGIYLEDSKKTLVQSRLGKRLYELGLKSFGAYIEHISHKNHSEEFNKALNLLTTNETYFFREAQHFKFLIREILPCYKSKGSLSVWSAASSSGEEIYSIAMILSEYASHLRWNTFASDININMVEKARRGIYSTNRIEKIPTEFLKKYFLRGKGSSEGLILLKESILSRVKFDQVNLLDSKSVGKLDKFDVVFLRNILIYFKKPEKEIMLQNIAARMNPNAWLLISHSESLLGLEHPFIAITPSIYRLI